MICMKLLTEKAIPCASSLLRKYCGKVFSTSQWRFYLWTGRAECYSRLALTTYMISVFLALSRLRLVKTNLQGKSLSDIGKLKILNAFANIAHVQRTDTHFP